MLSPLGLAFANLHESSLCLLVQLGFDCYRPRSFLFDSSFGLDATSELFNSARNCHLAIALNVHLLRSS